MAGESPWVLVASADAGRRMKLFRLLERAGFRATVVDDGPRALSMLRDEPFDAVLLDVLGGELDVGVVLVRIRSDPRLHRLPVFVTDGRRPGGRAPAPSSVDGAAGTSAHGAPGAPTRRIVPGRPSGPAPSEPPEGRP